MSEYTKDLIDRIDRILDKLTLRSIFIRKKTYYSPQGFAYATFQRRLFAATIDALILMVALMPFNDAIIAYIYKDITLDQALVDQAMSQAKTQAELNAAMFKLQMDAGFGAAFAYQIELQFFILALYSFIFWHRYAGTPGKLLLGMRIVDAKTGARITDIQSFFRIAAYVFSGMFLMLGFFAVAFNRKRRGWHDMFAGTVVIVESKRQPVTPETQSAHRSGSQGSASAE